MINWILISIILLQLYILVNLYRKVDRLRKECETLYTHSASFYGFILMALTSLLDNLRGVDLRGVFEADDEVGTTFRGIIELVEQAKHQISELESEE